MIVLQGTNSTVELRHWNNHRVWTTGVQTQWAIVQTYIQSGTPGIILVTNNLADLRSDMTDIYTITTDHWVHAAVVARGGYCLRCSFEEGLWRLQSLLTI